MGKGGGARALGAPVLTPVYRQLLWNPNLSEIENLKGIGGVVWHLGGFKSEENVPFHPQNSQRRYAKGPIIHHEDEWVYKNTVTHSSACKSPCELLTELLIIDDMAGNVSRAPFSEQGGQQKKGQFSHSFMYKSKKVETHKSIRRCSNCIQTRRV